MQLVEVHPMMLTKKLVVLGLITGLAMYATPTRPRASESAEVVKITASKFRFTPDHITLVKGQPITLQLTSTDRTHGFMIRALKIDTDIKPGQVTEMTMTVVVEEIAAKASAARVASASDTISK